MASALKINSGYPTPVGPLFVYHNTFLTEAPGTDAVALLDPGSGTFIRARNNVIAGTHYALYKLNPIPWDGDGNCLYTTDGSRLVYWQGTRYDTLAAYQAAVGQEAAGLSAPPQLVDPAGGDFTPRAESPLVDAALAIPGINDQFLGAAPDVGAVEASGLPSLRVSDALVREGWGGTAFARFRVRLSAASELTVTVEYATADGTAGAGSDYAATTGTLTFPPGAVQRVVSVPVYGDKAVEPDETFRLQLSGPGNAGLADGEGTATILNDDGVPGRLQRRARTMPTLVPQAAAPR
jgi:hypothetical protein